MSCTNDIRNTGIIDCGPDINNMPPRTVFVHKNDFDYFRAISVPSINIVITGGLFPGVFHATEDCKLSWGDQSKWVGNNIFDTKPGRKLISIE